MTKRIGFLLGVMGAGVMAWLWLTGRRSDGRASEIDITNDDLNYQNLSPQDLTDSHLVDLNDSRPGQLINLNLSPESLDRLIANRPYRSKLELVSRMVLNETEYESIKELVAVADGREPVKIA